MPKKLKHLTTIACEKTREFASTIYIYQDPSTDKLVMTWEEDMVGYPEVLYKSFGGEIVL